ncbi:hypothetical protein ACCI51_09660 [Microbulbifer echini]|uniref:Uncharacterized protein n=1 Tax=Microbulbifer echini TaxID=1529067 RepID=A0ABV4NNI0_9GAMM|nr:hypothetical protein [uncultured Microbulbifer sp.]
MSLYLKSAAFTPIENINIIRNVNLQYAFAQIGKIISDQSHRVLEGISLESKNKISRHFLCSTMIELPFTTGAITVRDLNPVEKGRGVPVTSFINTYECASWGYSLRYYLKQNPGARYVMVSILDANVLDLSFWQRNENWGKSGFGLCTLLLEVESFQSSDISAGCTVTYNTTPEFATIIRKMASSREDLTLSLPFFPENIRQIFTKLLKGFDQLPDLHDRWGHCFGSDPWLNIIQHGVDGRFDRREKLLACSIALNGYYCTAEVNIDRDSVFYLAEAA